MQIVSKGDNLHEVSDPYILGKIKMYFKMSSAEIFTQHAKHLKSITCEKAL